MKVILEGPDGVGKSTLAKYLENNYDLTVLHSNSETANTLDYHISLLNKNNTVLDRANISEIVYPVVYNRKPKMTWKEQKTFMDICYEKNIIYIIFYASDSNTLKERLFNRGDTEQVIQNIEKINLAYKMLAEQFSELYDNVFALDISKIDNQIEFFESTKLERRLNNE